MILPNLRIPGTAGRESPDALGRTGGMLSTADRERPNAIGGLDEPRVQSPTNKGQEVPSWDGEPTSTSSQTTLFSPEMTTNAINEPTSLTSSIANALVTATTVVSSIPSSTGSSSTGTSPQAGDSSSGSSKTETIAIAVPVSVVGGACLLGALFLLWRRRHRRRENPSDLPVDMAQTTTTNLLPQNDASWNVGHAGSHEIPFEGPFPSQAASNHHIPPIQPIDHQINATPRAQPPTLSVPPPPAGVTEHRQTERGLGLPETSPVTAGWQAGSGGRPRSPFDHPLDDAVSEVSGVSDRRGATHSRDLDDISSVSSIGDDERVTRR